MFESLHSSFCRSLHLLLFLWPRARWCLLKDRGDIRIIIILESFLFYSLRLSARRSLGLQATSDAPKKPQISREAAATTSAATAAV